jgi:hypothetical protein
MGGKSKVYFLNRRGDGEKRGWGDEEGKRGRGEDEKMRG